MTPREAIPRSWTDHLTDGSIGLGLDLGTTENETSNPSALNVLQQSGLHFLTRFLVAWKSDNPDVTIGILQVVFDDLKAAGITVRRLCIDASNETFFAKRLQQIFSRYCIVELVKGGQNIKHEGIELPSKMMLGNLLINCIEDGHFSLPAGQFIPDDFRLVQRDRGSFTTAQGKGGWHGDTFDGSKLALWALLRGGGKVQAHAVDIRGGSSAALRPGLIGPIKRILQKIRLNS